MKNKLIKREFLPVGKETQIYTNKNADIKSSISTRKRWFATMQCQQCGKEFVIREQGKNRHLEKPCEMCTKKNLAYNNFIKKAVNKHGNRFDYSLVTRDNYVNLFTPVKIICKEHGVFEQKPKDHTSKQRGKQCCPICIQNFNKIHNKRSIDSWKEELHKKTPHITMVKHGNSESNLEKCTLYCDHHRKFKTTLASIQNNIYICHKCALEANSWGSRTKRIDIKGILYFIYIPSIDHYKLGVTTTSVKERFYNLPYDYIVKWEQTFFTAKDAYKMESILFRQYKNYRPYSQYMLPTKFELFGGYTELLTCDIPITALQRSNLLSKEP